MCRGIGIICKARNFFKLDTLLNLYYSFIQPYMTYCIEVWGGMSKTYTSSLFKIQKKLCASLLSLLLQDILLQYFIN